MTIQDWLEDVNACFPARVWASTRTPKEIWEQCHRVDWLFWLLSKLGQQNLEEYRPFISWCTGGTTCKEYLRPLDAAILKASAMRGNIEDYDEYRKLFQIQADKLRESLPWELIAKIMKEAGIDL